MNKGLRAAAIAGIVYLVLFLPLLFLKSMGKVGGGIPNGMLVVFLAIALAELAAGVVFIRGFVIMGGKLKRDFLRIMAWIALVITTLLSGYDMISILHQEAASPTAGIIMLFIFGVVGVLFGASLLPLKKRFGKLATSAGVMEIISGAAAVTILLSIITILLYIPLGIVKVILLFRASEKFKQQKSAAHG